MPCFCMDEHPFMVVPYLIAQNLTGSIIKRYANSTV